MTSLVYLSQVESLEVGDILSFQYTPEINSESTELYQQVFSYKPKSSLSPEQVSHLKRTLPKKIIRIRVDSINFRGDQKSPEGKVYVLELNLTTLVGFFGPFGPVSGKTTFEGILVFQYIANANRIYLAWEAFPNRIYQLNIEKCYPPKAKIIWKVLESPLLRVGDYFYADYEFSVNKTCLGLYKVFVPEDRDFEDRNAWMKEKRFLTRVEQLTLAEKIEKEGFKMNKEGLYSVRMFGQVKDVSLDSWYTARLFFPEIHEEGTSQEDIDFRLVYSKGQILMIGVEGVPCPFVTPIYRGT